MLRRKCVVALKRAVIQTPEIVRVLIIYKASHDISVRQQKPKLGHVAEANDEKMIGWGVINTRNSHKYKMAQNSSNLAKKLIQF